MLLLYTITEKKTATAVTAHVYPNQSIKAPIKVLKLSQTKMSRTSQDHENDFTEPSHSMPRNKYTNKCLPKCCK